LATSASWSRPTFGVLHTGMSYGIVGAGRSTGCSSLSKCYSSRHQ
jgi:hypothetical protein